jgi:5-methylcytosine-specific restriction endonuclease McrA
MNDILDLPSLVLDCSRRPSYITNAKDSICDIISGKAISLLDRDCLVRSPSFSMFVPNVIINYSNFIRNSVQFNRLNIIYRDDQKCSYCGKRLPVNQLEIDHIVPKSKFFYFLNHRKLYPLFLNYTSIPAIPKKLDSWINCTTSCKKCNNKKGNKFLWDIDLKLIKIPFVPLYTPRLVISTSYANNQNWLPFLEKFNNTKFVKLIDV